MSTAFASVLNDAETILRASYTQGAGTVRLATGYGTTISSLLTKVGLPPISPTAPLRFTLVSPATYAIDGIVTTPERNTVFLATGLSGDDLTGLTVAEGTTDRNYAAGSLFEVYFTAGQLVAIQAAVNTLETTVLNLSTYGALTNVPNIFGPRQTMPLVDVGGEKFDATAAQYAGGAVAGVSFFTGGTMSLGSSFLDCPGATFTNALVGSIVVLDGLGIVPTTATITAVPSATRLTISYTASSAISASPFCIGRDSTAAINAAITAANAQGGGIVLLPPGVYLALAIALKSNVVLSGYGATIIKAGGGASTHAINVAGSLSGTTSLLTVNAARAGQSVTVSDGTLFAKGDYCLIFDLTYKYSNIGRNQEIVQVASVAGNVVTFKQFLYGSYAVASTATLTKLNACVNVRVEGVSMINPSLLINSGGLFEALLAYNVEVVDCAATGPSDDAAFGFYQTQRFVLSECSAEDGLNLSGSGYGYGMLVGESSLYGDVTGCYTRNVRENPMGDNPRCIRYLRNMFVDCYDDGCNTHGSGCENIIIGWNIIVGSRGAGIAVGFGTDHAMDKNVTVIGNEIYNCVGTGIAASSNEDGTHRHQRVKIVDNTIDGFGQNGIVCRLLDYCDVIGNSITANNAVGTTACINLSYQRYGKCAHNFCHVSSNAHGIQWTNMLTYFIEGNILQTTGSGAFFGVTLNVGLHVRWNRSDRPLSQSTFAGDEIAYGNDFAGVLGPALGFVKAGRIVDADVPVAMDGQTGVDTSNGRLAYRSTTWFRVPKIQWNMTVPVTVGNLAVQTSVCTGTALGSLIIPANTVAVGDIIELEVWGVMSSAAATPGTLATQLKITPAGGSAVQVVGTGAVTMVANMTTKGWNARARIEVTATGVSGTLTASGTAHYSNSTSSSFAPLPMAQATPLTVDWTKDQTLDMTVLFGTADPANIVKCTMATRTDWN